MTAQLVAFVFLSIMTLGGGLGVVTTRNVGHAALFLLVSLAAVAGVFILLLAEFLALVQILIYGGAITIVLLFTLMLTRQEEFSRVTDNSQRAVAALAALALSGPLAAVFIGQRLDTQPLESQGITNLGTELFTKWVIPFEVASLVLLVALIGSIVVSRVSERDE